MSVLLFSLSVALITFLILFNHQFRKGLDNNLAGIDLVIGAKGSPLQLILNSMYHVDAPTGNITIKEVTSFLNPKHPLVAAAYPLSLGDSYGAYRIAGTTPSLLNLYNADRITGRIYVDDFEVVVGNVVAEKLQLKVGSEFQSTHGLDENPDLEHDHGHPFVVTGILGNTGTVLDQLILCTPQTIWKVHEHDSIAATDHHHEHGAIPQSPVAFNIDTTLLKTLSDSVVSDLRAYPEKEITSVLIKYKNRTNIHTLNLPRNINQNTGVMAASPVMEILRLNELMGTGTDAIRYIAILIAIVAAISIFISLYTSLRERRYEMALMRINGAGPAKIFQMIIGEGMWIAILGLIFGLLIGHAGMSLAGSYLESSYRYKFTGNLWVQEEIYVVVGALLLGLVASIIPAIQGSRLDLHKTLAEN